VPVDAGDRTEVVVLDQQRLGLQDGAELGRAGGVMRRAGRVLPARREHGRAGTVAKRPLQRVRDHAARVERDPDGPQPERADEIDDRRPAGVLDRDPVAGGEMRGQPRTKLTRNPARGRHDGDTIDAILDEALIAHVAWVHDGRPAVIPTLIARDGDHVLIHGSSASRTVRGLRNGLEACIEVTLIDGLVLARSAFHHSINYRGVILYGTLGEAPDKERALEIFTNKLIPGRWDHVRRPTPQELKATAALALHMDEGSAKVRGGLPGDDDEEDYALDAWAGVVPIHTTYGAPEPDPRLRDGIETPEHVSALR
jgi:nitroimidazol reductase NimA-like FMN-containing flavoprotein (pyridoxamine 5'-phosphate oxidase superfamily)